MARERFRRVLSENLTEEGVEMVLGKVLESSGRRTEWEEKKGEVPLENKRAIVSPSGFELSTSCSSRSIPYTSSTGAKQDAPRQNEEKRALSAFSLKTSAVSEELEPINEEPLQNHKPMTTSSKPPINKSPKKPLNPTVSTLTSNIPTPTAITTLPRTQNTVLPNNVLPTNVSNRFSIPSTHISNTIPNNNIPNNNIPKNISDISNPTPKNDILSAKNDPTNPDFLSSNASLPLRRPIPTENIELQISPFNALANLSRETEDTAGDGEGLENPPRKKNKQKQRTIPGAGIKSTSLREKPLEEELIVTGRECPKKLENDEERKSKPGLKASSLREKAIEEEMMIAGKRGLEEEEEKRGFRNKTGNFDTKSASYLEKEELEPLKNPEASLKTLLSDIKGHYLTIYFDFKLNRFINVYDPPSSS